MRYALKNAWRCMMMSSSSRGTDENLKRFALMPVGQVQKLGAARLACPHRAGPRQVQAAKFAKALQELHGDEEWVTQVYSLEKPPAAGAADDVVHAKRPAFVISWKYSGAAFVATGEVGEDAFELDLPLVTRRLVHLISDAFVNYPARLSLWSWSLKWITPHVALLATEPTAHRLRPARLGQRPAAPPPGGAPPPAPPPGGAGDALPIAGPPGEEEDGAAAGSGEAPPDPPPAAPAEGADDELAAALGMLIPDEAAAVAVAVEGDGEPGAADPQDVELNEDGAVVEEDEEECAGDVGEPRPDEPAGQPLGPLADMDLDGLRAAHAARLALVDDCVRRVTERQARPRERHAVGLLVTEEQEVTYVQWTVAPLLRARPIGFNILANGNLNFKATPAFAVPEKSYAGATVVMDNTGLRFTRGKKTEQPVLDGWQLLAYQLQQAKLFGGPLAHNPRRECEACSFAAASGAARYLAAGEGRDKTFFWCQVCCSSWHQSCIENFGGASASPWTCPLCA